MTAKMLITVCALWLTVFTMAAVMSKQQPPPPIQPVPAADFFGKSPRALVFDQPAPLFKLPPRPGDELAPKVWDKNTCWQGFGAGC